MKRKILPISQEVESTQLAAQPTIAVVGGGPAGLRAAEVAATAGAVVTVYDAMPSVGRKFLVAGKSGLNLTNAEPLEPFLSRYTTPGLESSEWRMLIEEFDCPPEYRTHTCCHERGFNASSPGNSARTRLPVPSWNSNVSPP